MKKRCICGASTQFPICDGQHGGSTWSCSELQNDHHERIIISTPALYSLVEFLSHKYQMIAAHQNDHLKSCEELIIVTDGHSIDCILPVIQNIQHQKRRIIHLNCPLPKILLNDAVELIIFHVPEQKTKELKDLHAIVKSFINAPPIPSDRQEVIHVFMSHTIGDEIHLMPIVQRLRLHYGVHVFLCADSIMSGSDWYQSIEHALVHSDFVLAMCSEKFHTSTFCAFEIGMARALQKKIYPILLDQSMPPSYLQHLNAMSVHRVLASQPWLSYQDALLQVCFMSLQAFQSDSTKYSSAGARKL